MAETGKGKLGGVGRTVKEAAEAAAKKSHGSEHEHEESEHEAPSDHEDDDSHESSARPK